jgi:hypothetical protein
LTGARAAALAALVVAGAGCARAHGVETGEARGTATAILSATVDWRGEHKGACPTVDQLVAGHAIEVDPDLHRGKSHPGKVGVIPGTADPWGNAFRIDCAAADVHVRSAGPDGKMDTNDDVVAP